MNVCLSLIVNFSGYLSAADAVSLRSRFTLFAVEDAEVKE